MSSVKKAAIDKTIIDNGFKSFLSLSGGMLEKYRDKIVLGVVAAAIIHTVVGNYANKEVADFNQVMQANISELVAIKNEMKNPSFKDFVASFKDESLLLVKNGNVSFKELSNYRTLLASSGYILNEHEFTRENMESVMEVTKLINNDINKINSFITGGEIDKVTISGWHDMYKSGDRSLYLSSIVDRNNNLENMIEAVKDFDKIMKAHILASLSGKIDIDKARSKLVDNVKEEVDDYGLFIDYSKELGNKDIAKNLLYSLGVEAVNTINNDSERVRKILATYNGEKTIDSLSYTDKTRLFAFVMYNNQVAYEDAYLKLERAGISGDNNNALPYSLLNSTGYLSRSVPFETNTLDGVKAVLIAKENQLQYGEVKKIASLSF